MYKRKALFVVFEGIEGSGKSYQSLKLLKALKKKKIPTIVTREPGGTLGAERIRDLILKDYFNPNSKEVFNKYTDTLLYLAARNEHIIHKLKPAILKKKVVICDRFIDSTLAYQVFGKGVERSLIDKIHKHILSGIKPDITFLLKININKALKRLKKRKKKNRYDKFSKNFYLKAQKAFLKIAQSNKNKYIIVDNTQDSKETEKIILKNILRLLGNEN